LLQIFQIHSGRKSRIPFGRAFGKAPFGRAFGKAPFGRAFGKALFGRAFSKVRLKFNKKNHNIARRIAKILKWPKRKLFV